LTDFNEIWWGIYLQQNQMQHVTLIFIEHRYFKF